MDPTELTKEEIYTLEYHRKAPVFPGDLNWLLRDVSKMDSYIPKDRYSLKNKRARKFAVSHGLRCPNCLDSRANHTTDGHCLFGPYSWPKWDFEASPLITDKNFKPKEVRNFPLRPVDTIVSNYDAVLEFHRPPEDIIREFQKPIIGRLNKEGVMWTDFKAHVLDDLVVSSMLIIYEPPGCVFNTAIIIATSNSRTGADVERQCIMSNNMLVCEECPSPMFLVFPHTLESDMKRAIDYLKGSSNAD